MRASVDSRMLPLLLVSYRPLAFHPEERVEVAFNLTRQVPGRMLNIPTLKCGRAHATRKYRARGPPKSSICPHGTAAYAGPRRRASERVPGVVVGLPWGHCRWGL